MIPMLSVTAVSKGFPLKKEKALSDISFAIGKGEAVALVGENGAGKTTLIRILSLILQPDSGSISLDSVDYSENPGYVKSRTGTLFSGDGSLYDRLSAKENIEYYAQLNGVPKSRFDAMLELLTAELSLASFLNEKVGTFSRGMKQRTAIARTLISDPAFVILDEPSTGLDIIASESVKKIIARLKADGKTVLFSSHNLDEIFDCADRIIIVHKGRIVCDKSVKVFRKERGTDLTYYIKG
jgi:sodium transport system ATP-binding protein